MEGRFCGNCGKPLNEPATHTATSTSAPVAAPVIAEAASPTVTAAAPAQPAAVRNAARTMIGVMMPPGGIPAPATSAAPPTTASPPANTAQPATAPANTAQPATAPAKVANAHKTMVGVQFTPPPGVVSPAAAPATAAPTASPASSGPAKVANANKTMIGVTLQPPTAHASVAPVASVAPASTGASGAVAPATPQTPATRNDPSLYEPTASPRSPTVGLPQPAPGLEERVSIPGLPSARKPARSWLPLVALIGAALVVGGGVLVALDLRARSRNTPLPAQFEAQSDGTRVLVVRVADASPGATLSFESTRVPIENGTARLPASIVGDRVGRVDLPVTVTANGNSTSRIAQVVIGYVVRPELDGLGQHPPSARLVFRVAPGARLELDATPVQTDAQGQGIAVINNIHALPQGEALWSHGFSIRVQLRDGARIDGSYRLELPRAPMTVERPARSSLMTSAVRAALRVRAPGASMVLIDGQSATRDGEVFTAIVPTPESGPRTVEIRALRPQFAPALASVELERLPNDSRGVARFGATDAAPCAEGAENTGARVSVRGRVLGAPRAYNSGTTFQFVVQDRRCPGGVVPLWIDAEPDINVRSGESLRVVGTLSGTRTATTASGERRTDKVLHAAFVQR